MGKVLGMRAQRKHEVHEQAAVRQALTELDARIEMIQALIPLGLQAVHEMLHRAVEQLAGPRYQRGPTDRRLYRWGSERGSAYLADQKVAVQVPRVRDRHAGQEVRLAAYEQLRSPRGGDAQLLARVLRGIGCRNYHETAALVPEVLGLSASTRWCWRNCGRCCASAAATAIAAPGGSSIASSAPATTASGSSG
jgi:hypothetical protein